MAPTSSPSSFPRQHARTQGFTLGAPRGFHVTPDGRHVLFIRSSSGTDPVGSLWAYDVETASERLLADPRVLHAAAVDLSADLPAAERARRERLRESAAGIVGFATDTASSAAVFALSGHVYVVDIADGTVTPLPAAGPVIDPRFDPTGARVAYVSDGALHVVDRDGTDASLAADDDPHVFWGLAEFIAGEEIHRFRGYWWSPDGTRLIAARVDENPVREWHIGDPADPGRAPTAIRYPAAGTANADVGLAVIALDGRRTDISWDRGAYPYVVAVSWTEHGALLTVQSRDQKHVRVLDVDPATGATAERLAQDDDRWVEIVPGAPARLGDGRIATAIDDPESDTRRLAIDGVAVSPAGLQVLAVVGAGDDDVLVVATREPTERQLWRIGADGTSESVTAESGVQSGTRGGSTVVVASASMDHDGTRVTVHRDGEVIGEIASLAEEPSITPSVTFISGGRNALRTAVLLPSGHERGTPLPVLLDAYGGPHSARTIRARSAYRTSQWFADQGFAVVVADGRGTPARGPAWERAIAESMAETVLTDQVEALQAAAETNPDLDLDRVGIRGWSYGGYLAALAVLRRPDVFHVALAGAPVTDWTLYDTHYTERYLGDPNDDPARYVAESLIEDADKLRRPLLLIHGLADDNVVSAHTFRLSSALLAGGRPHTVLPLSGVTHMTPQEVVAENLLLLQVQFLRAALG